MTIMNSLSGLTKRVILPTTLAISGCGVPPEGTSKPDDEQAEKIEYLIDIADEATPLVKEIIRSMDGGWVDAHGEVDNPEAMIADIERAQDALHYYRDHGAIYVGPTSTMYGGDKNAIGFHSPADFTPTDLSDNYIVLNSDEEEHWDAELVMHEATHFLMYHDSEIEGELLALDDVSYKNPEVPNIINKHHDLAYMSSGEFVGPTNLLVSLDLNRRDRLAEARTLLEEGKAKEALTQLEDSLEMGDKDEWTLDKAEWIAGWSVFYAKFGVTTEILADDIAVARLYEAEQAKRAELIAEFTKEISEHRREMMKEVQIFPSIDWRVK